MYKEVRTKWRLAEELGPDQVDNDKEMAWYNWHHVTRWVRAATLDYETHPYGVYVLSVGNNNRTEVQLYEPRVDVWYVAYTGEAMGSWSKADVSEALEAAMWTAFDDLLDYLDYPSEELQAVRGTVLSTPYYNNPHDFGIEE